MKQIVTIKKISDCENPLHRHNIEDGAIYKGVFTKLPKVGESFKINPISLEYNERGFYTSTVQEIISDNRFRTLNSIYEFNIETIKC